MKLPFTCRHVALLCTGSGLLGLLMRLWLFAARDHKGLIRPGHFADIVTYLLLAGVMALLILYVRQIPHAQRYQKLFPANLIGSVGCLVGGVCLLLHAVIATIQCTPLALIALPFAICGAAGLLLLAYFRKSGTRPNVLLLIAPIAYLIVHTILQVRLWSNETQPTVYFFPLMAALFLMLAVYYHASAILRQRDLRPLVFFSCGAIFLCCVAIRQEPVFYLGMAAWLACDCCTIPLQRATPEDA